MKIKLKIDEIDRKIEEKIKETAKEAIPRQLTRSVASFKLYQAINDYVKYTKPENNNKRLKLMVEINKYIDTNKYGEIQVKETILDNQAAVNGFIPMLIDDLKTNDQFKLESHNAFWILFKFLKNTTGFINESITEQLNDVKIINKKSKTNITHIYNSCSEYMNINLKEVKLNSDNESKRQYDQIQIQHHLKDLNKSYDLINAIIEQKK